MPKHSAQPPKLSAKREKNRERILATAERLFYEKGFSATPLRELIKESGLSTTVFYSFFSNKRHLLVELILPLGEEINNELNAAFRDSTTDGDPIEKAIGIGLEVYARHRKLTKIIITETAAQNLQSRGPLRRVLDRSMEIVMGQLEIGVAKGYFRPVDPMTFAYSFVAMLHMHLYRWAVLGEFSRKDMIAGAGALAQVFRSAVPQRGST